MVIERFNKSDVDAIGERFRSKGRMLPDGVTYQASWVDSTGNRCFQLMEAPNTEFWQPWVACWSDLVQFEIIPVLTSNEFWSSEAVVG